MQKNELEPFAAMLRLVAEQYGKTLSPELVRLYFDGLSHLPLEAVRAAMNAHLRNPDSGQFMPKIADLIRALGGSTLDAAQLAWTRVMDAVALVGTYESVCFDDAVTQRVIADMGGWIALGAVSERELPFRQREFESRYRAYRARSEAPEHPAVLPGILDRDNWANGYATSQEPRLIGDQARALEVQRSCTDGAGRIAVPLSHVTRMLEAKP